MANVKRASAKERMKGGEMEALQRKQRAKHRRRNTWCCNNGEFQSLLNNRPISWAGTIARDYLYFLEYDHNCISGYTCQPFKLEAQLESGKKHTYTPDFLVRYADNSLLLVECKPVERLSREHTKRQIAIGQAWAMQSNHSFKVITDQVLRSGARLANLKLLYRYARIGVPVSVHNACVHYLQSHPDGVPFLVLASRVRALYIPTPGERTEDGPIGLDAYHRTNATPAISISHYPCSYHPALMFSPPIYNLLFWHILYADLDQPLTAESLIKLSPVPE